MGYHTDYTITVHNATQQQMKEIDSILTDCGLDKSSTFEYYIYGSKWYSWDEDLKSISEEFPNIYFEIYGDGEESDDNWQAIVCNGEAVAVQAELVYPPINIQKVGGIGKRCPELFI